MYTKRWTSPPCGLLALDSAPIRPCRAGLVGHESSAFRSCGRELRRVGGGENAKVAVVGRRAAGRAPPRVGLRCEIRLHTSRMCRSPYSWH